MMRTLRDLKELLKELRFEMYGNYDIDIIGHPDDVTFIDLEDFYESKEFDNYIVRRFEIFSHSGKTIIEIQLGVIVLKEEE